MKNPVPKKVWPIKEKIQERIWKNWDSYDQFSNDTKIPRSTIDHVVSGRTTVTRRNLQRFADAFGCDINEICSEKKQSGMVITAEPGVSPPTEHTIAKSLESLMEVWGCEPTNIPSTQNNDAAMPKETLNDFLVTNISLHFLGDRSDPNALEKMKDHVKDLLVAIKAIHRIKFSSSNDGSIVLTAAMAEIDAISMVHAFGQGRLDDLELFRIDFTKLTPKLEAAIAQVGRATGETRISRTRRSGRAQATLSRQDAGTPDNTETAITKRPTGEPTPVTSTTTPSKRRWGRLSRGGTIPPDQYGKSGPWRPTAVEAMVATGIIAVLIVLIVPSIEAARQKAALLQCSNNLKQIALALHQYNTDYNCFPPGGLPTNTASGNPSVLGGWSAQAFMLPYLERNTLYNSINFNLVGVGGRESGAEANTTVVTTRIDSFLCPSSPIYPALCYPSGAAGYRSPGNNYFASAGSSLNIFDASAGNGFGPEAAPNGLFNFGGRPITGSSVLDGLSNTIAFGEWRSGDGDDRKLTVPQDIVLNPALPPGVGGYNSTNLSMPQGGGGLNAWLTQCAGIAQSGGDSTPQRSFVGRYWSQGLMGSGVGTILVAPNASYPYCAYSFRGIDNEASIGSVGLSSYHPGGANVLMADGSVRFIKSTANQITIWSIATRDGGEVLSPDSF